VLNTEGERYKEGRKRVPIVRKDGQKGRMEGKEREGQIMRWCREMETVVARGVISRRPSNTCGALKEGKRIGDIIEKINLFENDPKNRLRRRGMRRTVSYCLCTEYSL
jgi:hypothetical protein